MSRDMSRLHVAVVTGDNVATSAVRNGYIERGYLSRLQPRPRSVGATSDGDRGGWVRSTPLFPSSHLSQSDGYIGDIEGWGTHSPTLAGHTPSPSVMHTYKAVLSTPGSLSPGETR